ncbi:MAG: hypothetical protein ACR2QS_12890 [Woeseiaceae bacterium]
MKRVSGLCLAFVLALNLAYSENCVAEASTGSGVMTILHNATIPPNGSLEEFKRLSARWTERVLKRNPHFSEIRSFLQESEEGVALLVVYVGTEDPPAEPLNDINQRLISEEWPDEEARQAFFDRLGEYVDRSRNVRAIYSELLTERVEF